MNLYVYILFYAVMLALSIYAFKADDKKRKIVFIIMVISFFIFYGIRDEMIGFDTKTYLRYYRSEDPASYIRQEKIFYLLSKLCWTLQIPDVAYIAIITAIISVLSAITYYLAFENRLEYLCIAYLTMFCFPYSIMMFINVMRQGIAVFSLLAAILFLDKGKKWLALAISIVGCMFHYMGFILLITFMIYYFCNNRKILISGSVGMCALGLIVGFSGLGKRVLRLFPSNALTDRVLYYLDWEVTRTEIIKLCFYLIVFCALIFIVTKLQVELTNLYKMMLVIFVITGVGTSCIVVAERIVISLDGMLPLLFLNQSVLEKIKKTRGESVYKLYVVGFLVFALAMFVFGMVSNPVKANMRF